MLLRLPPTLHYPITVKSLLKRPGDSVERGDHLFWYVYKTTVIEGDGWGNDTEVQKEFPIKFESSVDGTVVEWKISKGDIIDEP
jgi:RNA polymerase II subunit A-like phosphatase